MIDAASEKGFSVYVTVSREKSENEFLNIQNLLGMRVDGILACISQNTTDLKIYEQVKKIGIPFVFFDRELEEIDFSSVVFNDRNTTEFVINKIIEEGYTKIAHFAGYQEINIGKERCLGYKNALKKNNLKINDKWILEGGFEVVDGVSSFMKLYNENNLPEVILAVNDRVALGIYQAAKKVGVNIPEDIGIVAFGFKETAETFTPTLSIIHQDPRKIGKLAMNILLEEIGNKKSLIKQNIKIDEEFYWNDSLKKLKY
jgi:LacI family transcriptional regulator